MSNIIKYSGGTTPNSIKSGNFNIGVNSTPTDLTGFYNGISPINGGYTIYIDKASGGPSIYSPKNDTQLIEITNNLGVNVTTAEGALVWLTSQSNMTVLNNNYPPIISSGVSLNLDVSFVSSYPKTGTTLYDLSGNNYSGTTTNVGISYNSGIPGFFNLNGGYVENIGVTSSFSFIQNTGVFTISALVRPTDYTVEGSIMSTYRNLGEKGFTLGCGGTASGILDFRMDNGGGYVINNQISNFFTTNDWVLITIIGNGSNIQYYKDGALFSTSGSLGTLGTGNSGRVLSVGAANVLIYDWVGDISQTLIYNRALSSSEVLQNYNAILQKFIRRDNLKLSLDAQNTNLYAVSTTTAYDISGNNNNGTLTNGTQYVANGDGSWNFDAVNDYIDNIGTTSSFSFIQNTGIFTICAWVRLTEFSTTQRAIMGNNRNVTTEKGFLLARGTASSRIRFVITNGGGNVFSQQYDNYFLDDNWVFVTIVGNGTNVIYYRNGTLFQNGSNLGTLATGDSTRTLSVGRVTNLSSSFFWSGNISQTSIYDTSLTSTEILTIYNATKSRYGL